MAGAGGGGRARAEGEAGGGGGHGAAVARSVPSGGAGVVVAGAGGGGWVRAARGTGSPAGRVGEGEVDVGRQWRAWLRSGEREWWWRGLGVGALYGRWGEGEADMGRRWRSWWCPGERERRERGPGGSWWHLGEQERREWVVEARWECGRRGRVCCAGGERERRRLRDWASSIESGHSGGVSGPLGASRGAAWYWGGGVPRRPWIRHVGVWWRQRLVVWVQWLSLAGLGPGGPFSVDVVAGGVRIRFLVRVGWLVRGGWPLAVGGVCGWSARWLPSHPLVLFVHGGFWPRGVGRWAVVVVGVVLVVLVVGPLVVVVWVVVGLVLRVWPMDPLWVFRSPLWGWGVGHRGQSPGLHYAMGRGGGLGAGLDGDGGRGVPRPWVGLAGGGGGLWGMDDGALGDGDADEGLDGSVLGGRLCGGGGCRREGGAGCGGWGVLAWARVRAGVVSGGFVLLRLWCCVCSRGRRLGFGVGFRVGVQFQVEEYLCPEV